jgi:type IV secretory pathway VirJ component
VAPFLINRLPQASRAHVQGVALLGPSGSAAFEFSVASWLGGGGDIRYPTAPEVARLSVAVTCVSPGDDPILLVTR